MSLRLKLVTIILFVALVPLAVSSFSSLRLHTRAFDDQLRDRQRKVASVAAAMVKDYFDTTTRQLQVTALTVKWEALSAAERKGALWLVYGRNDDVQAVGLMDTQGAGKDAVFLHEPGTTPGTAAHPVATDKLLERIGKSAPHKRARADGMALGRVFRADGQDHPTISVAIRVPAPGGESWTLVVGMSLRTVCTKLARMSGKSLKARLIDGDGRDLCGDAKQPDESVAALGKPVAPGPTTHTFDDKAGVTMLAAIADAGRGWRVVAAQPRANALAPSRQIRNQALYWLALGVIVALVTGILLARGISKPIDTLVASANELAEGHYEQRIEVTSKDELGQLSRTFNHMGEEIERRDAEIRSWNTELQERVDERTKELADAQAQLLQSQKVAAVSTLGAGIAHEINNPLTTVLGGTQLVRQSLARQGDQKLTPLLSDVEHEAKRIRDIIRTMLKFSQDQTGAKHTPIEVNAFLDSTFELNAHKLKTSQVTVERSYAEDLPAILGNETKLSQAILHIVSNAIAAMSEAGGQLFVTTSQPQDKLVEIVIRDTGKGMAPNVLEKIFEPFFTTKDEWTKQGLGLTEAHSIIEEHHGTIRAESELGVGSSFIIRLPVATDGAHLV